MTEGNLDFVSDIVELREEDLASLKMKASQSPLQRERICLHKTHTDKAQEMIIAFSSASYVRPHRHIDKTESFHVIEGELIVVFFDDSGSIRRTVRMGPRGSGASLVYRMAGKYWHCVLPLSDFVIIHEVVTGPFAKHLTEFPDWAPAEGDVAAVDTWLRWLRQMLAPQNGATLAC